MQRLLVMARKPRRVSLAHCCFLSCSQDSCATEKHNSNTVVCRCRRGQSREPHEASCTQAEAARFEHLHVTAMCTCGVDLLRLSLLLCLGERGGTSAAAGFKGLSHSADHGEAAGQSMRARTG